MITSFAISLPLVFIAADTSKAQQGKDLNDLLVPSISISITDNAQGGTCNRNGGSAQSFEGTCDSHNYTWTDQCNVEERDGLCWTTANSSGCQIHESGGSSAVGSGSKDCANACVTIDDNVPLDRTCQASGVAMSFEGSCDSRGYTYTSACSFAEEVDDHIIPTKCTIKAKTCGCLWWEGDSEYIAGLEAGSKNCDACSAHGYPLSVAPGIRAAANMVYVAVMSAVWFVL
eukprot:CAMPEP_0201671930 /NCGR_PEP_ID=MMETSP0494-20130426/31117_1 /ASSEMBLY_ACC=CAM_ASM_000839 /TAXON_ID=420259 /ORGANISM="Thalassiosira gravida, Strain GMp14c1" /LENGTH=229 /DNA_ID=CAMNT_0048153437 /DNA_START=17 /DNA_END=706 /DNA_ORIENTATION=-